MTTKEKVFQELCLRKNSGQGKSISGEELARLCGVSRSAVWKAINFLRQEGCAIQGTTNGGYVLTEQADILSEEIFRSCLEKNFPNLKDIHAVCLKQTDSTNTHAKRLLSECAPLKNADGTLTEAGAKMNGAVIIAESQTAGRGRLGRSFVSPEKTGIYFINDVYADDAMGKCHGHRRNG